MIGAGAFDRRITIQRATESRDAGTNAVLETWGDHLTGVPCQIKRQPGNEFLGADKIESTRKAVFLIRFADVGNKDRVIADDGLTYDIRDLREVGRRRFLELQCEAVS